MTLTPDAPEGHKKQRESNPNPDHNVCEKIAHPIFTCEGGSTSESPVNHNQNVMVLSPQPVECLLPLPL
jgi:hypothetical protein